MYSLCNYFLLKPGHHCQDQEAGMLKTGGIGFLIFTPFLLHRVSDSFSTFSSLNFCLSFFSLIVQTCWVFKHLFFSSYNFNFVNFFLVFFMFPWNRICPEFSNFNLSENLLPLLLLFCKCLVFVWDSYFTECIQRSQNNFELLALSSHFSVGSWDGIPVARCEKFLNTFTYWDI